MGNNSENNIVRNKNSDIISNKLAAINNEVRFFILEVLKDNEKKKSNASNPLYSREINSILLSDYGIDITPQMLSQHLKQLVNAGLIMEVPTKKEVPNKIGKRNVKGYVLKEDAFESLFLEVSFLSEELLTFFDLYEKNHLLNSDDCCVLSVFNGANKGEIFKIHKNETALITAKAGDEFTSFDIILEDSDKSVIGESNLRIFYEDESWCIVDDSSFDAAIIDNIPVEKGTASKLKNHAFLKLYNGESAIILYCSF